MENTLYYCSYIASSLFQLYLIHRLMRSFVGETDGNREKFFLLYGFKFFLTTLQYLVAPYFLLNIFTTLVTLFLVSLSYTGSLAKRLAGSVLTYMCLFVSEAIMAGVIGLSNLSIWENEYNGNAMTFVGITVILWIISELVRHFRNMGSDMPVPKVFGIALIVVSMIILFLETIIFSQGEISNTIKMMSALCVLVMLFLLIYIYDSIFKTFENNTRAELLRREKNLYYNQSLQMQKNDEEVRKFRHDIKNHLIMLEGMVNEKDEQAKDYLSSLNTRLEGTKLYSRSGNLVIDSMVNYKLLEAEKVGIRADCDITVPAKLQLQPEDIVTILGNLLDNGIEAAQQVQESPSLYVKIEYKKGNLFILVCNSFDGKLQEEQGKLRTRKSNAQIHGIGLKNVEAIVREYNGELTWSHGDKEFEVSIMLYL